MKKILKLKSETKLFIMAIILIAIFCFAITPVTMQNDTYYTIKVGEHIKNYGVDMKEPFFMARKSYIYISTLVV